MITATKTSDIRSAAIFLEITSAILLTSSRHRKLISNHDQHQNHVRTYVELDSSVPSDGLTLSGAWASAV